MMCEDDIAALSDGDLADLREAVAKELLKREKAASKAKKAELAKANKRDPRCPECHVPLRKDGKAEGGVQRCECPVCGKHSRDSSGTSLSSSELPVSAIEKAVALIVLDCPDWVISWVLGIDRKTAQFWRDRCLDAASEWSAESKLSGHVWIDEMRFAPTRAGGFADGVWTTYSGRMAKDAYLEVAFDSKGDGCCRLYRGKLGMPTKKMVLKALGDKMEEGSRLTHDGAPRHNPLVESLPAVDDWCKFVPGDAEYEEKMEPMSDCCSYLRHSFESHNGIKFEKLEAYANFFMCRWSHVRRMGMRETISCLLNRVFGTKKSRVCRESFRKSSTWS